MRPGGYEALLDRVREIVDLDAILGLLSWDEETYAPEGARGPRGRHMATLEALRHQRLVAPDLGDLLAAVAAAPPPGIPSAAAQLRCLRRRREHALLVPEALVRALAEARSRSLAAWERARHGEGFAAYAPSLEAVLDLVRERAAALGGSGADRAYDALLDEHEPGATQQMLGPLLDELRRGLVPLVRRIAAAPRPDRRFLEGGSFPAAAQWQFATGLIADLGFDLTRGRLDRSTHPFTQVCSEHDVRLTTRIDERNPLGCILATVHEAGHGLYDQGYPAEHHGTFLADAPSIGAHESQARLWENQVARSRPFWAHYLPRLVAHFPQALGGVTIEAFYRAVNTVTPDLVRVDADEVTYNLHILLRYELEQALMSGALRASDLPGAWSDKMAEMLGVRPPDDLRGCLQDVHWALGELGYFPTYTLGNLYAAQLMDAFERRHPAAWDDIGRGDFGPLLGWLRQHVHAQGHLRPTDQMVREATGHEISVGPLLSYLSRKYGEIYQL